MHTSNPRPVTLRVSASDSGLATWWTELRQALRRVRRHPRPFALMTAIVALSSSAILIVAGLLDSVLLRPLPYPEAEQLVRIWESRPEETKVNPSKGNLVDFRDSHTLVGAAGWYVAPRTLISGEVLEVMETAQVSADFFPVLGVEPAQGRTFTAEETAQATFSTANTFIGADPLVVISHRLGQRLGEPESIVGREVTIDRRSWRVIGVMPADFGYPNDQIDLWIPWSFDGELPRDQRYLEAVGRLAAGVTVAQAQADLGRLADRLGARFPESNAGWGAHVEPMYESVVGKARPYLILSAVGISALVLLAVVHLMSLQWVRMAARSQELQVRRALGASGRTLLRSLVAESQLPVVAGVLLGLPLAYLALDGLRLWQPGLPRLDELALRPVIVVWTIVGSVGLGVLSGWLAALSHQRRAASQSFVPRDQRIAEAGGLSAFWAASEVALTLAVLMMAAWIGQTWIGLVQVETGFEAENVYVAPVLLDNVGYRTGDDARTYYRSALNELTTLPGIDAAGAATVPPLSLVGPDFARPIWAEGAPVPLGGHRQADVRMATPGYFATLGTPIVRGRAFRESDDETSSRVVVVSQALAEGHWPGEDPVGRRLVIDYSAAGTYPYEVVGVVGDMRSRGPREEPRAALYLPHAQRPYLAMNLVVRSGLAPAVVAEEVRGVLFRLDPAQPAHSVYPLQARLGDVVEQERSMAWLAALLGTLALALSALGVYSLLSVQVAGDRSAIGIRCALGADSRRIVSWIVGRGLRVCLAGLAVGMVVSALMVRLLSARLSALLFGIDPVAPAAFLGTAATVCLLILGAVVVASWAPAQRGASVDPLETLRQA
ncbi:MAG: ABC transporter permease [Thermoanaerobaculia bacterium]|nr:ABC transporter permease [Thermoanaerobaculia bacterium]